MVDFIDVKPEAIKADMEATPSAGGGGGGDFIPSVWFTPEVGTSYLIRLLPPWTGEGKNAFLPYKLVYQHWDIGPDGSGRVNCAKMLEEGECHVCEQMVALKATGDKADYDKGDSLYPGRRYIYQIIDRNDPTWRGDEDQLEGKDDGADYIGKPKVKFLGLGVNAHREMQTKLAHPDYAIATNVMAGLDLTLERTYDKTKKKSKKYGRPTVYGLVFNRTESPLFVTPDGSVDEEMLVDVKEALNDMDQHPWHRSATYDESKAIWLGEDPREANKQVGEGGSGQQGQLSGQQGAPEGDQYAAWLQSTASGKVRTRAEVAKVNNVEEVQIASCFSEEPEHTDDGCWDCPLRNDCAHTYADENGGKFSVNAPEQLAAPAAPAAPAALGGKKAKSKDAVKGMQDELSKAIGG